MGTSTLIFLLLAACSGRGGPDRLLEGSETEPEEAPVTVEFTAEPEAEGLQMRLYEAEGAAPPAAGGVRQVEGEALDDAALDRLLGRVPELHSEHGDRQTFALRDGSPPPPLSGSDVNERFPPDTDAQRTDVDEGPLQVRRFAPEGEVPVAPHVSVTFSMPMVEITSHEEASKTRPVQLTPEPPGRWRWLGTRTLLFDPEPRLPMATEYTVEIPAGTESATGTTLDEAVSFSFATPAPTLESSWPPSSQPQPLLPVIVVGFDQRVDRDAMGEHITVSAGGRDHPMRLASLAEIADDDGASRMVEGLEEGRWLALIPSEPLPAAQSIRVEVAKGAPSAEGPRTTASDQAFGFSTYAPLKVVEHHCWYRDRCPPTSGWAVRLNNPLDPAVFDASAFSMEPEVPGLSIQPQGNVLNINGAFAGRTVYTLTLPATLQDQFGQQLGEDTELVFKVGPADPTLSSPGEHLVVLDPASGSRLPVFSTNHDKLKIRVAKVTPADWPEWTKWMESYWYEDRRLKPLPGRVVHSGVLEPEDRPDEMVETAVDLSEWLDEDGHGQLIVLIEPTRQPRERYNRQYVMRWVQGTDLGLTAFSDGEHVVGWATELASGDPAEGVELEITPDDVSGTTGSDGLAKLDLPASSEGNQVLVARRGDDVALLPSNTGWWPSANWIDHGQLDQLRWYVTDDRGLYKPGETARVMGWIRLWEPGSTGDVRSLDEPPTELEWTLNGARGNELAKGTTEVSPLGGFQLELDLPGDANLGQAWLYLTAKGLGDVGSLSTSHGIQIQEFRRPEFEVTASADEGPHLLGQDARVDLTAAYYAGGGLQGAEVYWNVYATPGSYVPPDRGDWSFGTWSPWWMPWWGGPSVGSTPQSLQAKTDSAGEHHLGIHFESLSPPRPMSVRAEGRVMDVNRQAWTASSTVLVHPSSAYVGLKTDKSFVEKGEPIDVEVLAVDLDGEALPDAEVQLTFARMESGWRDGRWREEAVDPTDCTATASAEGTASCTFDTVRGGSYRVLARITDEHGRPNETELRIWVTGGEVEPARSVELERITLVPEQQQLQPGDTARLLVQAPFHPAEGVLSIRRSGIVRAERFRLEEPTTTLEIPIESAHVPDVTVQVDLVGAAPRLDAEGEVDDSLPKRVAHATGAVTFQVPPLERTLDVTATPAAEKLSPGTDTEVTLEVRDADGQPVSGAELAVVIADESVLALTGFKMPDPLDVFYAARGPGVYDRRLRTHIALADPEGLEPAARPAGSEQLQQLGRGDAGYGGGGAPGAGAVATGASTMTASDAPAAPMEMALAEDGADNFAAQPMKKPARRSRSGGKLADASLEKDGGDAGGAIALREDFSATALFAPGVRTDSSGVATVPLSVPDSLTRYRVMVVAVDAGNAFGSAEAAITARLPLMVRPSAPRFLNFGDQVELPIVLQNQTDEAMEVELAVRGTNVRFVDAVGPVLPDVPDTGISRAGRRVEVPANDRVEVRFPAATVMAGTARLQAVGAAGGASDAANLSLPVWTPATTEAFATYGEIDDGGIVQPVAAPPNTWTQFGGLEVTTSSTQLQALTDAVIYLQTYPYECNEQIASRLLGIASLRDVLDAFEAEGLPPTEDLEAQVAADLERLARRQHPNGGFAFWRRGDRPWPFLSIHVANAFARSKDKGYEVPDRTWQSSLRHLQQIESHIPHWYSQRSKWFLRAYALDVRRRMGDADVREARRLFGEAGTDGLGIDALGFLLPTLHEGGASSQVSTILRYIGNNVAESAAGAHFVTGYDDGAHVLLHSDRRADGIVLEALIEVDPDTDLIAKVVRGLLAHKVKGRWGNTQENAFVLLALDRYFRVFEAETPDFVARAWLGDGYVGDHAFQGRTTERAHMEVPMGYLTESKDPQDLTLVKDGDDGRLYYRIGLRYAPRDLRLKPMDQGFAVERVYEAIDAPSDVTRDDDGTWHIKAGARVRVRLTMAADMRRYHVALVDPLPAGLEAQNPVLATTGTLPEDPSSQEGDRFWWWTRTWYEHENLRDERVEAFASLLWDGVHEYSYVASATTPGRFVVPPAKAEEMYHPETFGRGATDIVVVK